MYETSKAVLRRLHDVRFATKYFVGLGLDIGAGNDPLQQYVEFFPLCGGILSWDMEQGDAQYLQTIANETMDFIHASHCLEHMTNPMVALINWIRVVKPGGYLIITVPDEDLYEKGIFPSVNNPDHKFTFTISKQHSWHDKSINVLAMLREIDSQVSVQKIELLDSTHRFTLPGHIDQTMTPVGECAIEIILRKYNG
jgi:ubiquinone/menaquinone biosynthesis C-methylase UbiE